ncbi:MAG: ABC transporter substrate-binding protein, partial [Promethearchaeota archaeon]
MKYKSIYLILFIALIIPFSSVFLLININLNEQNNVNRISVEPILSDVIVGNYTVPGISGPISLNQVLKIGILDDMNHISGEDAWKGALLAAREINEVGGVLINGTTYYIGLVVEDTRETSFDFDTALNAVDKMITIHKPHYIIGGYQEEVAYNYVENIMENKTPFVSTGLISDWWCERVLTDYSTYKYFFRITPLNSTSLANELVSYILYLFDYLNSTYGASTLNIGLLYENLIWTNDIRDSLLNLPILNPNITIVNQISFPPTMIDPPSMSTWLTNLESSGAQIVIPLISLGAGIIMSDQYEALKPGYLLAGINDYSQSDRYWDQTSGTCRYEILMQNIYNSSKTTLTMPFWNNFTGEYNNEPYYTGAGSYDAVRLLANVSFKAQSFNSDTIVAQLENINTSNPFPGVAGNIAFTPFHDLVEGWPFTTSLFTQWQMDGNKVVLPSGGSIYPDSLATGTLSIPYWGINNIVADYSHLLPGDFNLASDADDPDTNGAFNLIWTDSDGADNYSLYMSNETITYVSEKHTALAIQTAISPFLISGLRTGEYYFVIVAYNETGQKFSNNVHITVQLPAPGNFTLSSDADDPDTNGAFNLIWTDSDGADNYSVYTHNQFITKINGSLTNLSYQTAISPFPISGLLNGDYYYVVVAYNQTGQTMSNCIKITVQHPPPGNFDLSSDADDPDTNGAFNLIWTDSDGADNYSV